MSLNVTNQKPAELSPVYFPKFVGDMDVHGHIEHTVAAPMFDPLTPGTAASITDNGSPVSQSDVADYAIRCCCDVQDPDAEAWMKDLCSKAMIYYDPSPNMNVRSLFAVQSGVKEKLKLPSPIVLYTPSTDVIPAAKEFLAGKCTYDAFFATLAFYARPTTLGFYFANEQAFDDFKAWLLAFTQPISAGLPAATNQMLQDFQANVKLSGLTESLLLRSNETQCNEDYSFARMIVGCLMQYTAQVSPALFGIMPFDLSELYCPLSIVFVNVERHARATAKQVADEWDLINQSVRMKYTMVSNKQITRLTALSRSIQKFQQSVAKDGGYGRHAAVKFRGSPPSSTDLAKSLSRVIGHMACVSRSENAYKAVKTSFQKPNRRDPDDFNKSGKIISTRYKPDIHIYLDTSGSISEENYESAIKTCIAMARKMNIDLYFNSFSSVLSPCTKLHVKNRSTEQIYNAFQRVPKVSGGTDYEQIWDYVNRSPKRKRELSLIITDFEYCPPSAVAPHPRNIYYAPISKTDWKEIVYWARKFSEGMMHIDPTIRAKILF